MSRVSLVAPRGVLRSGWHAVVGDYARAGGFTPRGDRLWVADSAGGVTVLDAITGAPRWRQPALLPGGILAAALHPAGEVLAIGGAEGRILWVALADGRVQRSLEPGRGWVEHLDWSPSGARLAAGQTKYAVVWDTAGDEAFRSPAHPSTVSALLWSGEDELATACYGRVTFFDLPREREGQRLEWRGSLVAMVYSHRAGVVACGSQDNTVHFWRRASGQDSMMSGYSAKPVALAFDDAGTLLATGGGNTVTVWNFGADGPEGTEPGLLDLHREPVTALSFAPGSSRLAVGSRDGGVSVWILGREGDGVCAGAAALDHAVAHVCWRPDGRALAALDAGGGVHAWRVGE